MLSSKTQSLALLFCALFALSWGDGEIPLREPIRSLGVEGRYVTINGAPTFLVGQMSYDSMEGRSAKEIREILETMMVPFGMNLLAGSAGVIYWGAWNNRVNVERGLEESFRPHVYPWLRTGPGETLFGGSPFDLDRLNPAFFTDLAETLRLINALGIVPVVGIFSEHALDHPLHWRGHPFHPQNNVNTLGLPTKNALPEFFENPKALAYQEAYVRELLSALDGIHYILAPFGEVNVAPEPYILRWLDLFEQHERDTGQALLVCVSGRSEALDLFAPHPAVDLINIYCYHNGQYDGRLPNIPEGPLGIRQTLETAWRKYGKPVGKLYHKYGYPYADPKSPWADPITGTQGGGPESACRDALNAVYESGGFAIFFKMAWARGRGEYLKPDSWSDDIRSFWKTTTFTTGNTGRTLRP
jgi:uncharacterized protein DUF6298